MRLGIENLRANSDVCHSDFELHVRPVVVSQSTDNIALVHLGDDNSRMVEPDCDVHRVLLPRQRALVESRHEDFHLLGAHDRVRVHGCVREAPVLFSRV